jgi:hypothetical protein
MVAMTVTMSAMTTMTMAAVTTMSVARKRYW